MEYALLFMEKDDAFAKRTEPTEAPTYWAAWQAYIGAMRDAGVMTSGNGLEPPASATRVSVSDGGRLVEDGPFADAKEQLGGYVVLDVPDFDTAVAWAARSPAASIGHVEVRPVMPPPAS